MELLRLAFAFSTDCAAVRQRARQVLNEWQSAELVDDTLLIVTELMENVVQHTGGAGQLTLRRDDDTVRIEVADSSADLPRVFGPDPRREGGRGLLLVAAISRGWGAEPRPRGKVVWAEVPLTGRPA